MPVVYDGRCIGTINLTHRDGYYNETHLKTVEAMAPSLVAYFLAAASGT